MRKLAADRRAGATYVQSLFVAICLLFISACAEDSNNDAPAAFAPAIPDAPQVSEEEAAPAPFQELLDQGIGRYLGAYSPMSTTETDGVVNYFFGEGEGPLCLEGGPYTMATRDQGSEDLLIFVQGGGACWFDFCAATTEAETGILNYGLLDSASATNPVAGWNTVYMPYCDGGLHASDADVDSDDDGTADRFHRGLHNTSAALDVAVQTFPAPRRILLAGVSGGGYGSIFALPLVRHLYPGVPIEVVNDYGIGIGRPGDAEFNNQLFDYWNINAFVPESCGDCLSAGNPSDYFDYQLQEDDNFQLGFMSHKQDFTIGTFFLAIGGEAFEEILLDVLETVESRYPDRVRSFVRNGIDHTFLGDLSLSAGGVTVSEWISSMLDDPDNWQTVIDE